MFVLAHASADPAIVAATDLTNSAVINFNGDDAVVLRKNGVVVDAFGQIGTDPGSQWTGGGQDDTLRRNETICAGDTNADDTFDASTEWDTFPINTFDGLGTHTTTCGGDGGPADPVINEFSASTTGSPDVEWIEILGSPNSDYSTYTLLEIEGDTTKGSSIGRSRSAPPMVQACGPPRSGICRPRTDRSRCSSSRGSPARSVATAVQAASRTPRPCSARTTTA